MSTQTIQSMVNWIERNITRNPTLTAMSGHVGYSRYYCSAKFHENIGMTFKQYVALRKLSHAARDVERTRIRFIDIALKYGFSSHEAFTRAFLGVYGCTPYDYRKRAQSGHVKER